MSNFQIYYKLNFLNLRQCLRLLFIVAIFPSTSLAQTFDEQLPIDRILDQNRLKQQQDKLFEPSKSLETKPIKKTYKRSSDNCIEVKKVEFLGDSKLSKNSKTELSKDLTNNCVFNDQISELLKGITNIYIAKGYTNARAYFKGYDLETGILNILISEGMINSIRLNNIRKDLEKDSEKDLKINSKINSKPNSKNSFFDKTQIFFAFPTKKGKLFKIDDIEQGLNNMNRLRQNNAVIDSRPANSDGASDVVVNNQKGLKLPEFLLSYNNYGSKSTGIYTSTYGIKQSNLFYLNETIGFAQIKSSRSETNVMNFNIPCGYYFFSYTNSKSKFHSYIGGSKFEGRATSHDLSLSRLLYRDKKHEFNINTNLSFRDQNSKINNNVNIASQRLSTGRIGLDYKVNFKNRLAIYTGLTYSKGLKIHNATNDKQKNSVSELTKDSPRAQFHKLSYNFNLYKPFKYLNYNLQANAQHSNYALYGSELLFAGGNNYTVRGLQYDGITGATGGYVRNDLSLNTAPILDIFQIQKDHKNKDKFSRKFADSIINIVTKTQPFIFYDHGFAREIVKADENKKTRYVSGAGIGLKYAGEYIKAEITYAKSLTQPRFVLENNEYQDSAIYFGISGQYWF